MRSTIFCHNLAVGLFAALQVVCTRVNAADMTFVVQPVSETQAADYKLDPAFFKKATLVQDILIATSAHVSISRTARRPTNSTW